MVLALTADPLPLMTDANGVVRVSRTRVTLDTVVTAFLEGATAEEIVEQYPSLQLSDVYSVIGLVRRYRQVIFIDRDPDDPAQGWGWVEVDVEDVKRFGIDTKHPEPRVVTKRKLRYDSQPDSVQAYDNPHHIVYPPSRDEISFS